MKTSTILFLFLASACCLSFAEARFVPMTTPSSNDLVNARMEYEPDVELAFSPKPNSVDALMLKNRSMTMKMGRRDLVVTTVVITSVLKAILSKLALVIAKKIALKIALKIGTKWALKFAGKYLIKKAAAVVVKKTTAMIVKSAAKFLIKKAASGLISAYAKEYAGKKLQKFQMTLIKERSRKTIKASLASNSNRAAMRAMQSDSDRESKYLKGIEKRIRGQSALKTLSYETELLAESMRRNQKIAQNRCNLETTNFSRGRYLLWGWFKKKVKKVRNYFRKKPKKVVVRRPVQTMQQKWRHGIQVHQILDLKNDKETNARKNIFLNQEAKAFNNIMVNAESRDEDFQHLRSHASRGGLQEKRIYANYKKSFYCEIAKYYQKAVKTWMDINKSVQPLGKWRLAKEVMKLIARKTVEYAKKFAKFAANLGRNIFNVLKSLWRGFTSWFRRKPKLSEHRYREKRRKVDSALNELARNRANIETRVYHKMTNYFNNQKNVLWRWKRRHASKKEIERAFKTPRFM